MHGLSQYPLISFDKNYNLNYYIYGLNGIIAYTEKNMSTENKYYVLKDHLGSTRVVINNTGDVVSEYLYDAFGEKMNGNTEAVKIDYQYTGQEFDEETGLHNYRARFYDSDLMRFYTVDPEEQFASSYLFCGNNPVMFIDPTGCYLVLAGDDIDIEMQDILFMASGQESLVSFDNSNNVLLDNSFDKTKSPEAGVLFDLVNSLNTYRYSGGEDLNSIYPFYLTEANNTMITLVPNGNHVINYKENKNGEFVSHRILSNDYYLGNETFVAVASNSLFYYDGRNSTRIVDRRDVVVHELGEAYYMTEYNYPRYPGYFIDKNNKCLFVSPEKYAHDEISKRVPTFLGIEIGAFLRQ